MKLKKKTSKTTKIIVIIAVILAVAALITVGAVMISKKVDEERGKELNELYISIYPDKLTYYIGEEFDPTGINVQVTANNGNSTFIKDPKQLTFEGFDSSIPCEEQEIKVSYMGVSTTMSVVIKEWPTATPILVAIEVKNLQTTYQIDDWNKYKFGYHTEEASIDCIYSDGSVDNIPLSNSYISGVRAVEAPCMLDIIIKYSNGGVEAQQVITITVTE